MAIFALHEAELALLEGAQGAVDKLAAAEAACDRAGLVTYRDAARVLLGHVVGGQRGEQMRRSPLDEMKSSGVEHPEAYLSVFAPTIRRYLKLLETPETLASAAEGL
jgi:hypothetical protein